MRTKNANLTLQQANETAVDSADAQGRVYIVYRQDGRHGDAIYGVCHEGEWMEFGGWNAREDWMSSRTLPEYGYCVAVSRTLPHVGP